MVSIKTATYLDSYRIALVFANGEVGTVDLTDIIREFPAAAALRDTAVFKAFALDEWPTLVWPNGFDLSPEMLYERATGRTVAWLHEGSPKEMKHPSHA